MAADNSTQLLGWIVRMNAGDDGARDELIARASQRLLRLSRRMLADYRAVGRWEDCEDVLQNAMLRLLRALQVVRVESVREFFRLAALQIRRELLDLSRRHFGPEGLGANHASAADAGAGSPLTSDDGRAGLPAHEQAEASWDPARLARWTEFHGHVESLPDEEREVFDLLWYQELTHDEAAAVLGSSASTVRRRWRSALLKLHAVVEGDLPRA